MLHLVYLPISIPISFWGSFSSMNNIFIIQKDYVEMGPRHTVDCFKALDIITVPCLYIYTLMLNALNNLNIFQTNSSVHCMKYSKLQNKLHIPSERLSSILRGVYYSSVKIFNQPAQYAVTLK
jgi:hypothetical protein